jgi:predicted nucleic acid-binding protein
VGKLNCADAVSDSSRRYFATTIDASVFLNAFNPYEAGYAESHRLLVHLQSQALPIIVPTLLLAEAVDAIARGRDDADLARAFAAALRRLPRLVWVPVDGTLAQHRLRGSDAVYVAVALRFGSTLITLDREQRQRCADTIVARYPAEALSGMD